MMKYANLRAVAAVALALVGTAGCAAAGHSASPSTGPAAATGTTSAAATSTTSAAATSRPPAETSPVLADGRSAVYLTGLGAATVTFDLIEFLTGDAAKAEWKKQHPSDPEGPDNDYLIVNNNTKLRTLPVAAGAHCLVLTALGGTTTKTIGFAALPAYLKEQNKGMALSPPHITVLPFWLTVKNGKVTKFEEQFLP
jgi:hypothetical protein